MKNLTDADIRHLLRAADPAASVSLADTDAAAIVRHARPSRPSRRRWLLWATALAAAVSLGVPAGAVATGFAARTGWFGSPNPGDDRSTSTSTESDDSEWLDLGAEDLPGVVASLYPEWLPLAPGVDRAEIITRVTEAMAQPDALGQQTLVLRTFEYEVYRDWISAWIAAHRSGNTVEQARAAEVLRDAADWPAMVATDGGGVTDLMRAFAARISAGDAEAAQALAQIEHATGWDGVDREQLASEILREAQGEQE